MRARRGEAWLANPAPLCCRRYPERRRYPADSSHEPVHAALKTPARPRVPRELRETGQLCPTEVSLDSNDVGIANADELGITAIGTSTHAANDGHDLLAGCTAQAAAGKLHRAQPSIFLAVKNLESELGFALLDRSGYRVGLTEAGRSFHERVQIFFLELRALKGHATQLAMGEEGELRVVIGDLCPLPQTLALLRRFFDACSHTRLHLHFEAISGPWERLFDGDADLILHHIDRADPLCAVCDP